MSTARPPRSARGTRAALLLSLLWPALAACGEGARSDGRPLGPDTLAAWQACIEPDASELAFERIPWLPSYVEGVQAANAQRKPLLLWIMNGHPLGCT